jgi:hypothetical protein
VFASDAISGLLPKATTRFGYRPLDAHGRLVSRAAAVYR